jgi:heptosyltransferase-1
MTKANFTIGRFLVKAELYAKIAPMPRLLIVKTSSLGDVIHNLPILADIRSHYPDMQIDWVVEESFADIPALHPAVDHVIPIALRRWRHNLFSQATWREIAAARARLRTVKYDLVLDTQGLVKSAVVARQANPPWHGYIRNSIREPIAAVLYTHCHTVSRQLHAVARNRQLAAMALGYPIPQSAPDYGIKAPQSAPVITLPARYAVGLHATSRDSKLWPEVHWIALGRSLAETGMALVLPWGNGKEHQRALRLADHIPGAVVLPRLRLSELAAIIAGGRVAVGVDTGLVHLAVALGIPTVAIYTDTDPGLTGTCPGLDHPSINLGGAGQIPSPETVLEKLAGF